MPVLISALSAIPGIDDLSLTTNGTLLEKFAKSLAEAGLKRVNISLDTLDADKFRRLTRGGDIELVWRGIEAASAAGLHPLKINSVVIRGLNTDDIVSLAELTQKYPWHIRFIEYMPIAYVGDWGRDMPLPQERYYPVAEMRKILSAYDLQPFDNLTGNGPELNCKIPGSPGTIGFISPIGEHFCSTCNRLRLTADGCLRSCLMSNLEVPVRAAIRQGHSLDAYINQAVALKPERHNLDNLILSTQPAPGILSSRFMIQIGG